MDKELTKKVEGILKKYPYYQISIDAPGLGSAIDPSIIIDKYRHPSDPVGSYIDNIDYKKDIVNKVNCTYDMLSKESKRIIQALYFEGNTTKPEEVMRELVISKNKYYKLKKEALYKFSISFGLKY